VQEHLLVANVGDSKDVISRGGKAFTSSPTQLGLTDLLSSFTCLDIIIKTSEMPVCPSNPCSTATASCQLGISVTNIHVLFICGIEIEIHNFKKK
jgi:hypothetical protein